MPICSLGSRQDVANDLAAWLHEALPESGRSPPRHLSQVHIEELEQRGRPLVSLAKISSAYRRPSDQGTRQVDPLTF